jgi:hypothetical protein
MSYDYGLDLDLPQQEQTFENYSECYAPILTFNDN